MDPIGTVCAVDAHRPTSSQSQLLARRSTAAISVPGPVSESDRRCSRPLCSADAEVLLAFDYETRHVVLCWVEDAHDPNLLELCVQHADRFRPPHGWTFDDVRAQIVDLRSVAASTRSVAASMVLG